VSNAVLATKEKSVMSIDREERKVNEDDLCAEGSTTHLEQSEEPANFVGRQWENVKRLHGWRRPVGMVAIGVEMMLLAAAVVALLII
jgi:hypothetical protein